MTSATTVASTSITVTQDVLKNVSGVAQAKLFQQERLDLPGKLLVDRFLIHIEKRADLVIGILLQQTGCAADRERCNLSNLRGTSIAASFRQELLCSDFRERPKQLL